MMRISLVTVGDPSSQTGGHLYQRRLAEAARPLGAEVDVVALGDERLVMQRSAVRGLAASLGGVDAVLVDSLAAAAFAGQVRAFGVPVVGLVHQRPGGPIPSEMRLPMDVRAYLEMDALVATGPGTADALRSIGVGDVAVVPPGTDAAPAIEDPPNLRAGRQSAVLCVANWLPSKQILELVAAFERLPASAATLHLVGDRRADHRYAKRVERELARSSLRRRVVVHGVVPHEELPLLRAGAEIFALPSIEESFGMAWAEAMAAGLPIVGWAAATLPSLVTDGREGLLVPVGDRRRLTKALATLAFHPELRRRLGAAARHRASDFPTWEDTARAVLDVVSNVSRQPALR
jgi:glycosyltransferase involved in cell wall biosynthesis